MRTGYILFLFIVSLAVNGQDKLFFKNGKIKKGFIVSSSADVVFFKNYDTSVTTLQILKADLLMIEDYKGGIAIFSEAKKPEEIKPTDSITYKENSLGVQPLGVLFGRVTIVYERFTKDNKIGFAFPISLTFDPSGRLYSARIDTSRNAPKRLKGINFIGGIDVNFYIGRNENSKFFVGPRIRYGTDMFLEGIEAYSVQTQFGWKFGKPNKAFIQHLSFGFGVVRILSSPAGAYINPKQSYPWFSANYRIGVKW